MSKVLYSCAECGRMRANKPGLRCFFCESGARIAGLQRDLTARGASFAANVSAREVKTAHRHRHVITHGKHKG